MCVNSALQHHPRPHVGADASFDDSVTISLKATTDDLVARVIAQQQPRVRFAAHDFCALPDVAGADYRSGEERKSGSAGAYEEYRLDRRPFEACLVVIVDEHSSAGVGRVVALVRVVGDLMQSPSKIQPRTSVITVEFCAGAVRLLAFVGAVGGAGYAALA
jgi:hypothetical protein